MRLRQGHDLATDEVSAQMVPNYATVKRRPTGNWFWLIVLLLIVLGAIVLVTCFQLNQFFKGMETLD